MKILRRVLRQTPFYLATKRLGHYPDYWYWKLRGEPARPPHLLKQRMVKEFALKYSLRTLVETGTYYGEMVASVKDDFEHIFSIEFDPRLAAHAKKRFKRYTNIRILEGSSETIIPELLLTITQPALFWLDAGYFAWQGDFKDMGRMMTELDAIFTHSIGEHVVLIDDVVPFSGRDGTPELQVLLGMIKGKYPERVFEENSGILCVLRGDEPAPSLTTPVSSW